MDWTDIFGLRVGSGLLGNLELPFEHDWSKINMILSPKRKDKLTDYCLNISVASFAVAAFGGKGGEFCPHLWA